MKKRCMAKSERLQLKATAPRPRRPIQYALKWGTSKPSTEKQPQTTDMDLPRTTKENIILDKEDRQPANNLAELLTIHHHFGHISMRELQEMTKQGILPQRLSKCREPTCAACLHAKATKQTWQSKPKKNGDDGIKPTKTWTGGVGRPTCLPDAWIDCPDDWIPDHKALPLCNCLS